jgi:glycosyltransferase involved in cell wall biosynthesis
LPDKRVCFDFFRPITMTGDVIDAHLNKHTRHRKKTFFDHAAYFALRAGNGGWAHSGDLAPLELAHSIYAAQQGYMDASEDPASEYRDTHAWTFTPKSFELIILELNLLGHIDWAIRSIEPADGVEFYVWLERRRITMPEADINPARLALLKGMVRESADAIAQLDIVASPVGITQPVPSTGPGITAVIPLYNGAAFIEEALESIFAQTLPAREIIVVNDGSTDDGAGVAIVERLAKTHPITLIHKPNGGQSSARNLGAERAKTELFALLDQDDIWYPNHLEELVKPFLEQSSPAVGWVYSNLDEIDEFGHLVARSYLGLLAAVHPKRHIFDCIRQDMFILPSASLINRQAFLSVGGFDEQLCGYEDDDLFMRMFRAGFENIYIDKALSKWRIYPGSTSYSFRMARSRGIYTRKLLEMFPDDAKRARYYARDLIVPRFFDLTIREYETAIELGDLEAIESTWNEVLFLARHDANTAKRLLIHSLSQYRLALAKGDKARISMAWNEVSAAADRLPPGSRKVRAILGVLRSPLISRSAFAVRKVARPAMRWAFSV